MFKIWHPESLETVTTSHDRNYKNIEGDEVPFDNNVVYSYANCPQ